MNNPYLSRTSSAPLAHKIYRIDEITKIIAKSACRTTTCNNEMLHAYAGDTGFLRNIPMIIFFVVSKSAVNIQGDSLKRKLFPYKYPIQIWYSLTVYHFIASD